MEPCLGALKVEHSFDSVNELAYMLTIFRSYLYMEGKSCTQRVRFSFTCQWHEIEFAHFNDQIIADLMQNADKIVAFLKNTHWKLNFC